MQFQNINRLSVVIRRGGYFRFSSGVPPISFAAMNLAATIRQQFAVWGVILALWCLLVLGFAGQMMLTVGLPWPQALMLSLREWFAWAFLAPAAAFLAFRFPLERPRLLLHTAVHVAACIAAVVLCEVLWRQLAPQPGSPNSPRFAENRGLGPEDRPFPPGEGPGPEGFEGGPPPRRPAERAPARGPFAMQALVLRARSNLPVYWIIVSIVQVMRYYRRAEERERKASELEARLTDAKLHALQMQLQPHFLFNTLNAISTLMHRDTMAADEMLGNLSELLRATLNTTEQEIPLREEMHLLERYLEIQRARFGERLTLNLEVQPDALDALVPTLILQPLVENSMRHGIEPQVKAGAITVSAQKAGERLLVEVRDNGVGLKPNAASREGIGISNTRTRLRELHGDRAKFNLTNVPEGGCSARFEIPFRSTAEPDSARLTPREAPRDGDEHSG